MKIKYSILLLALGSLLYTSCRQEEIGDASAVASSESFLVFEAKDAPEQKIMVYADGKWAADVSEDWISVSPMSGTGHTEVTVSVEDNLTGNVLNVPRRGSILFQGDNKLRRGNVTVSQNGDAYFDVKEYTIAQIYKLQDKDVAKVASAQVTGLSKNGAILTDESGSMYATAETLNLGLGDKISFNGAKATVNGIPAFILDEVSVSEKAAAINYPAPKDITSEITSYKPGFTEYVKISASLVGTNIRVNSNVLIPIMDPLESLDLARMDLHKVVFIGYGVGTAMLVTAVEDAGPDESLIPYPLKFKVRVDGINFTTASFSETSRINPVQGIGYIEYVPFDLEHTNDNNKYALDVSDKSPRCTGPWPGDYWLFYGNGAIKAGSEVRIAFEARTSATGHKFWLLEFLDGEEWRPACETQTSTESGETVVYTHAMNADGSTNVQADYIVKYRKNNPHAEFRFRCVANWQANGSGKLGARNGGSARLTVTDTSDETYQPTIQIISEGNGIERDPVYADIQLSTDLLTFNGTPDAPKELVITSDYDFSLSSDTDWLSFDKTEGLAGEETSIAVTCAPSELSELRQGVIKIVSEDSVKLINVVQSAAGQQLDPFISLSSGNKIGVGYKEGTFTVRVQTNTDVQVEPTVPWLSAEAAPGTKGMVEWKEYTVSYEANPSEDTGRDGGIRFYNSEYNLEAFLSVSQGFYIPSGKVWFNDDFEWLAPYIAAYKLAKPADKDKLDPVGSNLASHAQPNLWNDQTNFKPVTDDLYARGYEDLNKSAKTLYMQENYFKMGATNKHTGLRLPGNNFGGDFSSDIILTFDWCAHMTGAGAIDNVTISVIVEGAGFCADSGKAESNPISTTQETGKLAWQHASVNIKGVTKATRIVIRPTKMFAEGAPSQQRWHLDNIKIVAE